MKGSQGWIAGMLSLNLFPFGLGEVLVVVGAIGLALLVGTVVVVLVARGQKGNSSQAQNTTFGGDEGGPWTTATKVRYAIYAVLLVLSLGVYLALDRVGSVSLYWRFVALYAAFWVLVGALLLPNRPLRIKLSVLALLIVVLFGVRYLDWNSRKPFLRDLYSLEEGMTPGQVEQVMGGYMPCTSRDASFDGQDGIWAGSVTYRHTDEGWGNSDWGVVTFEDGRLVETEFLPD